MGELVGLVMLDVALIAVLARLAGVACRKIGQPSVVGEVIVGILLGPTLLGAFGANLPSELFAPDVRDVLRRLGYAGLVVFMFGVGLQLKFGLGNREDRSTAALISITSVVLPFSLGVLLASVLYPSYDVVDGMDIDFLPFALFIGVSVSITAFPVLARIIEERKLAETRLGALALACAAADDVLMWLVLAGVLAVFEASGGADLAVTAIASVVFTLIAVVVVRRLLARILAKRPQRPDKDDPAILLALLAGAATSAWITHAIGIHFVFGAFLFGAVVPRAAAVHLLAQFRKYVEPAVIVFLLPIFFVIPGLESNLRELDLDNFAHLGLIVVVATTGKVLGAGVPAKLRGFDWRETTAIAALMNTRGLMELVVLNIGLTAGLLDTQLFSLFVLMALVTTILTGPILSAVSGDSPPDTMRPGVARG